MTSLHLRIAAATMGAFLLGACQLPLFGRDTGDAVPTRAGDQPATTPASAPQSAPSANRNTARPARETQVDRVFDGEDMRSGHGCDPAQQLRRLAAEHAAEDERDDASLTGWGLRSASEPVGNRRRTTHVAIVTGIGENEKRTKMVRRGRTLLLSSERGAEATRISGCERIRIRSLPLAALIRPAVTLAELAGAPSIPASRDGWDHDDRARKTRGPRRTLASNADTGSTSSATLGPADRLGRTQADRIVLVGCSEPSR